MTKAKAKKVARASSKPRIIFAAVHDDFKWRVVTTHTTEWHAVDGEHGARFLLLTSNASQVRVYGAVVAVFVWKENETTAQAFFKGCEPAVMLRAFVEVADLPGTERSMTDGPDPVSLTTWRANSEAMPRLPPPTSLKTSSPCEIKVDDECEQKSPTGTQAGGVATPEGEQEPETSLEIERPPGAFFQNEISVGEYVEGAALEVLLTRWERHLGARNACIKHYGAVCRVCDLDFEKRYGPIGTGFIHIHHEIQLADIREEYQVDPINHLKPVCPNCHAMLHREDPPMSIAQLRERLAQLRDQIQPC
ncbi:hypothetical protein [Variovorax sp. efr-133-TYG-130]|uniref:HNH endonuclease n=1 Tax=Variovorax sp. efr-133-TYG-130 TaxID=3040327 RepID=UPI0025565E15|nr:hypothetical protein [Variovorax sp. efr-133-TYG-130]